MSKVKQRIDRFIHHPLKSLSLIYGLTCLSFANIFRNQFVIDDFSFIVNWPLIRDLRNIPRFFVGYVPPMGQEGIYAPFKTLFHALTYHFFGEQVIGYHVISLLVHGAAVFFVYKIIQVLTRDDRVTFVATLFFALHPVHCESITSITASIDTIGSVFLLVAFYLFITRNPGRAALRDRKYILSLAFAALAVATQELTAALPFLIGWYDYCFANTVRKSRGRFRRVLPYFVIVGAYLLAKYAVLGGVSRGEYIYGSFALTLLVTLKALLKYALLMFFPVTLTHNHVISPGIYAFDVADFDAAAVLTQSVFDPRVLISLGVLGGALYVIIRCLRDKPLISFAIGWFYLSLLPALNIIPSNVYFAERYLYFASLGFCLLAGLYFKRLYAARGKLFKVPRPVWSVVILALITGFYAARVAARNHEMRNEIALFKSAIRANPRSALMRNDLGIIYTEYGQPQKAICSFCQALALKEKPVTYFAMAEAYTQMGQNRKAEQALRKAIELDPAFADAYYNLASLYGFWGRMDAARDNLETALAIYRRRGDTGKARRYREVFEEYYGSADREAR
jgi:hypothetical protein